MEKLDLTQILKDCRDWSTFKVEQPKPASIYHEQRVQQFRDEVINLAKELYIRHEDTCAREALEEAYNFMTSAYHFRDTGGILSMINIEERYDH